VAASAAVSAAGSGAESAAVRQTAVSVRSVSKTFDGGVLALDGVNFEVPEKQFISVLGPSGCGKSTLLRILGGLFSPDSGGEVRILGRLSTGPSPDVGIVFQTHNLLPWLTLEANIRLAAEVQRIPPAEIAERTERMLEVLRIASFRLRYPHELSGGMRQRAAFGQILILYPQILLLDEPFGALDALTRDKLNVELLRLWEKQKQTVVLITHSIAEAVFLSDRVLVMSDRPGRIIADMPINLQHPRDPQIVRALPEFTRCVLELSRMMGVV
jgi:NitT/TauT family transport system ATP-binding protein